MQNTSEAAIEYNRAGIQLLPLPYGSKAPRSGESWKERYAERPQTAAEVRELFPEGSQRNVAWIAGSVSGNLAIVDFDSRSGIRRAVGFERFRRFMERTSVSRTGSGLLHVGLRTPFPCRTRKVPGFDVDIRGEGSYAVEPFSLHPDTRQPYLWDEEFRPPVQIADPGEFPFPDWLLPYLPDQDRRKEVSGLWTDRGLGSRARAILAGSLAGFPSRSEAELSVMVRALSIGWTPAQIEEGLRRWGARSLRSVSDPAWCRRAMDGARRFAEQTRSAFDRELDAVQHDLETSKPAGRTGWTDRAVELAIVQVVRETGPGSLESIGLSEREVAARAAITRETARKALRRLLPVVSGSGGRFSARYDVSSFLNKSTNPPTPIHPVDSWSGRISTFIPGKTDSRRRKALGPAAHIVLGSLTPGDRGRWAEWSERWGLGKGATLRRLGLLVQVGLMELGKERTSRRPAHIWTVTRAPTDADMISIAREAGTLGDSERQRRRHEAERSTYRRILDYKSKRGVSI